MIGKYIYGIINSREELSFGYCGISSDEVYTISYEDVSAVVSDSEVIDYAHRLKDVVVRQLVSHQKAIEEIMSVGYTIIPVKIGTFAIDREEVKDTLERGYTLIKEIFKKITDILEFDLATTWDDFNAVLKAAGEKKEIIELKEKLFADPEGITPADQMKVGFMVKKALDEKKEGCAREIHDVLKPISQNFKAHEVMDDRMVTNSAFLIEKSRQKDFDKKLNELDTLFGKELKFRCIGPLPPYSFYTLEINKIEFQEIDLARKKLGLSDFTTKDDLKKAHQAKALIFHPDRNPDKLGTEKEFNDITQAYKLLLDYSNACEQAGGKERFSFKEEDFKRNRILIKVKE